MENEWDECEREAAETAKLPERPHDVLETHTCPKCGRRLLSIRSKTCNWCGAIIQDEAYQKHAAEERAEFDADQERELEIETQKGRLIQSSIETTII